MENKFFQKFLETGLFDIGDQDERLDHLEKSIVDLEKVLENNQFKIPNYTLVALDSNISDEEPVLKEVENIVTEHWKTLRIKHIEMPRQILRGVILNALYNLGKESPLIARLVYLTGSNFFPYAELGKEKLIIRTLLIELSDIAEENAISEWLFEENIPELKLSPLKLKDIKLGEVSIDRETLEEGMLIAVKNEPTHNHGSNHGGNGHWGKHFSEKSTEIIADTIDNAVKELGDSLTPDSIETPINKFFTVFKKTLNESLKSSFNSMRAVERRSKLLWWKESLYSKSFRKSYRELDQVILPLVMSWDLYQELPTITPVSVDFLLKDTFHIILHKEIEIDFASFFNTLNKYSSKQDLESCFNKIEDYKGRISISDFIQLFIKEKVSLEDFHSKTGIKLEDKISYSNLSIAILHDTMVQYIISQ